jgi:DNA polymerase elongation subunit (family B)
MRPDLDEESKYFISTRGLCAKMLEDIQCHSPVWLIGYNSYRFDNLFSLLLDQIRTLLKVFDKGPNKSLLETLYVRGVNNVDVYPILDSTFRAKFSSLRLDTVAKELNLGCKLHMPLDTSDERGTLDMIEYNPTD